ncbi:hypothetical protein D8B23_15915 [Verminephrobacter aporrectodeae subsp. tuberculatae]|uniref:NB-ARC domain-containing protein n=1 Tax=Verminephrobacter aporrectodeae TaxID=1110389 RepID=UPI002243B57A|nr:NB-ARC domain-containing protein [Verminephrobacter aporrectodeae]MCW8199855.1 hypothetical protein [Verminephrobacter aporrectodeae subsp. tuberculatae]
MKHAAMDQIFKRVENSKSESDFTYFFSLLLASEALAKTIILGIVASIVDSKDRDKYRLESQLVRADGLGDWCRVLEDALTGNASQFLLLAARVEQTELTKLCKRGDWQYEAAAALKVALDHLSIDAEELPTKSDMKRWFRFFVTLRNKTRGHGATQPQNASMAAEHIAKSLDLIYRNFKLFQRPWVHLHRNLSGKYRVSYITEDTSLDFTYLTRKQDIKLDNGMYIFMEGAPRRISLMETDPELNDFFIANGGMNGKKFELLSYCTDKKYFGDGSTFLTPSGTLPPSETQGKGELLPQGNCLSNLPELQKGYVSRPDLEADLFKLLMNDRHPIVTLLGRGGIGKTSLALKVIQQMYTESRYQGTVWLSSRDVDLHPTGPKPVRPSVFSLEEMGKYYANLVLSPEDINKKEFNARKYFEQQLQQCDLNPCLFIFDNFETTQSPIEIFKWIDSFIRLPNKVLITTRLREFNGDYQLEVGGMTDAEARLLVKQTAMSLGIISLLKENYISDLIKESEGHPYVMKVLLGEVVKNKRIGNIKQIVAGTEDVLTALFERTYAALSPCSQRAFLTLSAWNSPVPRLALEAVLFNSTRERSEVKKGIESLLQYSMAEVYTTRSDEQDFISLPLIAGVFGRKKLNISPSKGSIHTDVEFLQMMGPSGRNDMTLGVDRKLKKFISNMSRQVDSGVEYDNFKSIIEFICQSYNKGWLIIARWHMGRETSDGYAAAKEALNRFLENDTPSEDTVGAWTLLEDACKKTGDAIGGLHARVECACLPNISYDYISETGNRINSSIFSKDDIFDREQMKDFSIRILNVLSQRISEARPDDYSRMAWLALHSGQESVAIQYVKDGLAIGPENYHLISISKRLGIAGESGLS